MRKIIVIAIFLTAAFFVFLYQRKLPVDAQGRVVITLTEHGFSPSSVRVPTGTRMVFRTRTDRPFWPASNFHPSHLLYPAFDPASPVAPQDEWEFTFDRVGTWGFHNHLRASQQGTVIVFDPATGSHLACSGQIEPTDIQGKTSCWYEQISEVMQKEGVAAGFALVRRFYNEDPLFVPLCHDMTHFIGETAFHMSQKNRPLTLASEVANCGYGFFHGFIEALMFAGNNYERAFAACLQAHDEVAQSVAQPNVRYTCYHGIGHGIFDSLDSSFWGDAERMVANVLDVCERITGVERDELRKQCATGVFNALANAYGDKRYGLALHATDPLWICRRQADPVFRRACTVEVSLVFIRSHEFSRASAIRFITSLPDREDRIAAMYAYIGDETRLQIADIDSSILGTWCWGYTQDLRTACLEGIEDIVLERGRPEHEYEAVVAFCSSSALAQGEKAACFERLIPRLATIYSKETLLTVCTKIPQAYYQLCLPKTTN